MRKGDSRSVTALLIGVAGVALLVVGVLVGRSIGRAEPTTAPARSVSATVTTPAPVAATTNALPLRTTQPPPVVVVRPGDTSPVPEMGAGQNTALLGPSVPQSYAYAPPVRYSSPRTSMVGGQSYQRQPSSRQIGGGELDQTTVRADGAQIRERDREAARREEIAYAREVSDLGTRVNEYNRLFQRIANARKANIDAINSGRVVADALGRRGNFTAVKSYSGLSAEEADRIADRMVELREGILSDRHYRECFMEVGAALGAGFANDRLDGFRVFGMR